MTTPSQRGKSNRRKGAQAERDVVTWLRANGWPHAERAIAMGARSGDRVRQDPGDLTGTPGLVIQVKDVDKLDQPAQLAAAMAETEEQRAHAGAHFGVLVQRRRGTTDVGRWHVWVPAEVLAELVGAVTARALYPVRLDLAALVDLLRRDGFGTEIAEEAAS